MTMKEGIKSYGELRMQPLLFCASVRKAVSLYISPVSDSDAVEATVTGGDATELCEKLAAAERRIGELESMNEALRSGIELISGASRVETILDSFLREAVRLTGSPCGALADHISGTEFSLRSLTGCNPADLDKCSLITRFRVASQHDSNGLMKRILRRETFAVSLEEIEQWCPELAEYHRERGRRSFWHFPIVAAGDVTGFLALAFDEDCAFCEWKSSIVQVLNQQASLALNVVRIAEAAKVGAVANERARVAQDLAAELSQVNLAMRAATDQLATQTELGSFYGQVLQQSANLLHADSAHLTVIDEASGVMRKLAYLKHGALSVPDSAIETPLAEAASSLQRLCAVQGVHYFDPDGEEEIFWPGARAFYRETGHRTVTAIPLTRNDHCLGFVVLAFREKRELSMQEQELLQAMAQHMTLAMHLTRLSDQVRRGAVLEERVALARDLHDTLLQGFTGVALQLRALLKKPQEWNQLRPILEGIEAEATRSIREARRAVGDIRGIEPGTSDLVTALQELVHSESTRTHAHLCWRLEGEQIDLPRPVAESLFLIGREALTNAIRHAHAGSIEVALAMSAHDVELTIRDNGQGFALSADMARKQGHWGLVGIEERVERLGGHSRIESKLGQGTTVSVHISL
jgi:signal transduction histidine kinase